MPSIVAIERCETYNPDEVLRATRKALELLGGLGSLLKAGDQVLLKPNMLSADRLERAVTTHPSVVEAMILLCREVGAVPTVGDSPALGNAKRTSRGCGIAEVCERHKVPILDLGTSLPGKANAICGAARPQITDQLGQFDAIVNLPKVKVHEQIHFSLAVKNLFGCVPGRRKALWHFLLRRSVDEFARMLVATLTVVKPVVSVVDAIVAMERVGPRGGDPRHVGLVLTGTDCVALDRVLLEILGVDPEEYPILNAAREMGVGETDLSAIEIRGLSIAEARVEGFQPAEEIGPIGFSLPHIIRGLWRQLRRKTLPVRKKPV